LNYTKNEVNTIQNRKKGRKPGYLHNYHSLPGLLKKERRRCDKDNFLNKLGIIYSSL
jgi:hypothetical protein